MTDLQTHLQLEIWPLFYVNLYLLFIFPTLSYSWFWLSIDGCKLGQVMDNVTFSLENGTHIPAARTNKIFFEIFACFLYILKINLAGWIFKDELADEWWTINYEIASITGCASFVLACFCFVFVYVPSSLCNIFFFISHMILFSKFLG